MSLLTAQEFIDALERDSWLQEQFEVEDPDDIESIVDFAAEHGYHFNEDEFTVALQAFPKSRLAQEYGRPSLRIVPYDNLRD